MPASYAVAILALWGACHVLLAVLTYIRVRRPRVVCCPVTGARATITVDALRGALLLTRPEDIAVVHCSEWLEHRRCFQACRERTGSNNR
jgi:hypothetical protein